ncbi:MAG: hypothetical protein IT452_10595 [Planctomycetia bacterium]|nr:hypothetical protein [Planctomycetia bacterium]
MLQRFLRNFFHQGDARRLNGFRIAFCTLLAAALLWKAPGSDRLFVSPIYSPIPLFEQLGIPLVSLHVFRVLRALLVSSLVLAAAGILARPALAASVVLYFLYLGTYLGLTKQPGTNYVNHSDNMAFFVLLVLAAAPKVGLLGFEGWWRRGRRWAATDEEAACSEWALPLIATALGVVYFGSAWCKLVSSPLWADGTTLQAYLGMKHLTVDAEWGFRLAQHWWLCLLGGIATIVFELLFCTVVFFPRFSRIYALAGLCFHGSILVTMKINFFATHGFTYLVFLFWPSPALLKPHATGTEPPPPPQLPGRAQTGFSLGLIAFMFACVFLRIESWPFSDFRVFQGRNHPDLVRVFRVGGLDAEGRLSWPKHSELPRSETTLDRLFTHHVRRGKAADAAQLLEEVRATMAPAARERYRKIVLVVRTLETAPDGSLRPADEVLLAIPSGE